MYYEFESRYNMKTLIFDDDKLIIGEESYPYSRIEKMEVTSAQLFASYGILTIVIDGKEHPIPFPRTYASKIKRVLREVEKEKEKGPAERRTSNSRTIPSDPYEEVKKLKELLDLEIITKEEFDRKKRELLNL